MMATSREMEAGWTVRVMAAGLFFLLATVATVVFLEALGVIATEQVDLDGLIELSYEGRAVRLAVAALSAVIAIGMILLAKSTLHTAPPPPAAHLLAADNRGMMVVAGNVLESVVEHVACSIAGVERSRVRIRGGGTAPVRLHVDAHMNPRANLAESGKAVRDAARSAARDIVGLTVQDVVVVVHVPDLRRTGPRRWLA